MANEIATSSDADPWFDDNSSQCLQADSLQLSFVEFGTDPKPLNFSVTALDALLSIGCDCKDVLGANSINESNLVTCAAFELSHGILAEVLVTLAFALIVACAVAGNATVIWIILAHRRMRTVTNYFLLNLALADMSISVLNVIFSYTQNFYYRWFFGLPYCYVSNMMGVAPTVASSTTLMVMSWERYMVIVFPMRRRLSRHESLAAIASIWLFAIGSAIPNCALTDYLTYVRLKKSYVSDDNVNRSTVDLVHACSVDFSNRFATMLVCLFCLISVFFIVFVLIITLGMLIYFHFIHSLSNNTPNKNSDASNVDSNV